MNMYRLIGRAPIKLINHKEVTDEILDLFGCLVKSEYFYASNSIKAFDMLDVLYPDTYSLYTWSLEVIFVDH